MPQKAFFRILKMVGIIGRDYFSLKTSKASKRVKIMMKTAGAAANQYEHKSQACFRTSQFINNEQFRKWINKSVAANNVQEWVAFNLIKH